MKIILSVLLLSMAASAGDPLLLRKFTFNYAMPLGSGQDENGSVFYVEKIWDDFHLQFRGTIDRDLVVSNAPMLLTEAESISLQSLDLQTSTTHWRVALTNFALSDSTRSLRLREVHQNCILGGLDEFSQKVISGCIEQLSLQVGAFYSGDHDIRDLSLQVREGEYEFKGASRRPLPGRVSSKGNVTLIGKVIRIEIKEVKFGLLNITSKIFSELEKLESSRLEVRRPFIFLNYDSEAP